MNRPLVPAALIFCSGIWAASLIKASFILVYMMAVLSAALCLFLVRKRAIFNIFLCCFLFCLSGVLWKNAAIIPSCHILRYVPYADNRVYAVKGLLRSRPLLRNGRVSFILSVEELRIDNMSRSACGDILVYAPARDDLPGALAELTSLDYGDEALLRGRIRRPSGYGGPRRAGYRDYLYNQGIYCVINVKTAAFVSVLGRRKGAMLRRFSSQLKRKIEEIIFKRVSFIPAVIMDAMMLGEKRKIPLFIRNSMMRTGSVHILVVSGFHVALVVFMALLLLKSFGFPRSVRFFIAAPLIIIYCLMTGSSAPAVRATVISIVLMSAPLFKREADIYNSLALAAIFILSVEPGELFNAGFQLSFVSVISIVCLSRQIRRCIPPAAFQIKYTRFILEGLLVSLSAWIGTAGLVAYYFKIVSPVAVIANIFVVPLASLVTLCGFSMVIAEFICPYLAPFFASSSELAVSIMLNINAFFARLPGAYFYLP